MGLLHGFTFKNDLKEMFSQIRKSSRRAPRVRKRKSGLGSFRIYNPQIKKLDPKTISGYFFDYCIGSRGSRFFCPSHTTRIVESDIDIYFEVDFGFEGSNGSREPQFR